MVPERQQLLALAEDLALPQAADHVALEQMNGHRELRLHEAARTPRRPARRTATAWSRAPTPGRGVPHRVCTPTTLRSRRRAGRSGWSRCRRPRSAWTSPARRRAERRSRSPGRLRCRSDRARRRRCGRSGTASPAARRSAPRTGTASAALQAGTLAHGPSPLRLRQITVHQHHCHRPFADGGCHSFGGFGTHITCNKHTRHTCFQVVRRAVQRPAADVLQVGSGEDEAVVVAGHHSVEPLRCAARRR